jgi:hypothetical protein
MLRRAAGVLAMSFLVFAPIAAHAADAHPKGPVRRFHYFTSHTNLTGRPVRLARADEGPLSPVRTNNCKIVCTPGVYPVEWECWEECR